MARPEVLAPYKRKYTDEDNVSLSDLHSAYQVAAKLVSEDGDQYLSHLFREPRISITTGA